jgi:hypothetical protein
VLSANIAYRYERGKVATLSHFANDYEANVATLYYAFYVDAYLSLHDNHYISCEYSYVQRNRG